MDMLKQLSVGVALVGLIGCSSSRAAQTAADSAQDAVLVSRAPEFREVTIGAGTILPLTLESAVASNVSHLEDHVQARLSQPLVAGDMEAIPRGSLIEGVVSDVQPSGKVSGRARLAIRFNTLVVRETRYDITTMSLTREAAGTKKKDAEEIGIPAAGAAIVGALIGGKKGAGIGAAVGGGAGTAYVLSTPGKEVRLGSGERVSVRLAQPLTIRVPAIVSEPRPRSDEHPGD
jgi:hypothetical protein